MDSKRATNFLLLVIAICLVLIVVKLYDVSLITEAQAASTEQQSVRILGCYQAPDSSPACQWVPVRVSRGGVLMSIQH